MLRTSTNVVASQRRGLVLPTPHSRLVAVGAVKQAAKPASKPAAKPVAKSQVVQKGRKQEVPQKQEESTITIPIVNITVSETIFTALAYAVLAAQITLIHAAYSGHWSRMDLLSEDTEQFLQKVVIFILCAHTVVAILTGRLAATKQVDVISSAVKGFFFGTFEYWKIDQSKADKK